MSVDMRPWALAVLYDDECERFDRTLPGAQLHGEWVPLPGEPHKRMLVNARKTWERYANRARGLGIEPAQVRRELTRRRIPWAPLDIEAARRIIGPDEPPPKLLRGRSSDEWETR